MNLTELEKRKWLKAGVVFFACVLIAILLLALTEIPSLIVALGSGLLFAGWLLYWLPETPTEERQQQVVAKVEDVLTLLERVEEASEELETEDAYEKTRAMCEAATSIGASLSEREDGNLILADEFVEMVQELHTILDGFAKVKSGQTPMRSAKTFLAKVEEETIPNHLEQFRKFALKVSLKAVAKLLATVETVEDRRRRGSY